MSSDKMMSNSWQKQLLAASARSDEKQEEEFLNLIDEVEGKITQEIACVLLKTFTDKPDFGTQERVLSVLASGEPQLVATAILLELPRLLVEAPEWAKSLIGEEVEFRPDLLAKLASGMPKSIKAALASVLTEKDFQEFFPAASALVSKLS